MITDELRIWKMPLKSERDDFLDDPTKVDRARQFCFDEGWLGIGWECDSLSTSTDDPLEYQQALKRDRVNDSSALSAHRAIAEKMETGDFVWCRAKCDIYWLGKVEGPWNYRNKDRFEEFDLYQVRKCRWQRVGPADTVPGPVKNAYAGRGSAISQIRREAETAAHTSNSLWTKLTGETTRHALKDSPRFTLSSIGHDDLEDLVALYLQAEKRWYVVPSTVKRSTPFTEFVLRNSEGQRAYLQVKSGETHVDSLTEVPADVDRLFLFDLDRGNQDMANPKIERIDPTKLEAFARTNKSLLPAYMQGFVSGE